MGSTVPNEDVSILVKQLSTIKASNIQDEAARKSLFEAARNATFALETPGDTIQRITHASLQTTMARIASDLALFEILSREDNRVLNTKQLAEITTADEVLLGRLLRYLASVGMIEEVGENQWLGTETTKTLSVPGLRAGIYHNHDMIMPCWQALPKFLADTKYQNPTDPAHCAFQEGHNTEQMAFQWALSVPSRFDNFNLWMAATHEGQNTFLDVYPFEKELCHGLKPETPLFVDVGGGIGQQCLALKQKFPHLSGRVVNQDLPPAIAQALPCEGVEHTVHDFTTKQPIEGARAYYLRNIMHDYPDDKCIIILRLIMDVMDKDSVILIDDMVLPNQGAHWRQTQLDLLVMAGLAAMERTERQWYSMLDAAGLKVKQIYTYTPELRDSIIAAVPR
ncbi:hypothetical protein N7G274_000393 [Stereocaulon virgatum]|uniref:O-methyltransferase domain-containing protein n=1 Tax=Stereocaulon virgatum TaxID=373712 RepID=A0ABR4AUR7_9LECA